MIKIITIIGARPQFIKAAVVSKALRNYKNINEIIIHTGQHFDFNMDKVFFNELKIPDPKYNLNINTLSHGEMTGLMLINIEKIVLKEKPDFILVYGDTNSTLAGALAGKKLYINIAHVEAGLRSFNTSMPEEINRIITDRISDILFCPTLKAVDNLQKESFQKFNCKIINSGDVMLDLALFFQQNRRNFVPPTLLIAPKAYILCTIHREENTNNLETLNSIINALNKISKEINVILPLHPRTRKILTKGKIKLDFETCEPLGYFEMMTLLQKCKLVITDSGGLQKEAYFFKKNCVTIRNETEWVEIVEAGCNKIAGTVNENIYNAFKEMIDKKSDFNFDIFGDGNASEKIISTIISY